MLAVGGGGADGVISRRTSSLEVSSSSEVIPVSANSGGGADGVPIWSSGCIGAEGVRIIQPFPIF